MSSRPISSSEDSSELESSLNNEQAYEGKKQELKTRVEEIIRSLNEEISFLEFIKTAQISTI